ncbi:MAG: prepilin-type N-terminal cleavage/methylation domain-containing protein [Acidobacteria bacterium]|nr:prepilin-type N-terminal cleavage/methylation domain-containing protein [Acidobacteriota bacterium]
MGPRAIKTDQRGFTIVELLMATAIIMIVTGALFGLLNPAQGTFQAQPEAADMQQRLRVAIDALHKDLLMAGAGTYSGAAVGMLNNFFAPVVPYRVGTQNADPARGVFYRPDAISVMYVPTTASQCIIAETMPNSASEIKVNAQPGCPKNDPLCGFNEGMRVLIFDDAGAWDTFTITAIQSAALHLQHGSDPFSKPYELGARIAQVAMHTYWFKSDPATETFQLMHYDGYQNDIPIVENVVGFQLEYFGEPRAPELLKPVSDPKGPWTTYGPRPPALGVDVPGDTWPAGENCAFTIDAATGRQVSRLPALNTVPGSLMKLDPALFTDGPWCPDGGYPSRYDADLLRIRRVRVTLRVQASEKSLRGPAGTLFTRAGTTTSGERYLPDQEVQFDVTPRNLNLGR